jgi:hypothetical protein
MEEGLRFHLRLRDLEPDAPADVYRAYVDPLLGWLAQNFPGVDDHHLLTAIHDTLLAYVNRPERYDPGRLDLGAYLRMGARADLLNLLSRERRHQRGRVAFSVVELDAESGNLSGSDGEPSEHAEREEEAERCRGFLREVTKDWACGEKRVLELLLAGERKDDIYARALGIDDRPRAELEAEVKRVKDRVKKRLERKARDWHD